MKVLITGAHFTPAQAVVEELLKYRDQETRVKSQEDAGFRTSRNDNVNDDIRITYVGRGTTREGDKSPSVESQILPKLGVKFIPIIAGRVRRYISIGTFVSLFKIPIGFGQAFLILLQEKPDLVVSFGGYVAVPLVFCAWLLNIPVIIHEQTLVSGLANTFSALFADRIAVSFEQKYSFSEEKVFVTGNPMRKKILEPVKKGSKEIEEMIVKAEKQKKPLILFTGGNQGAHSVNLIIEEALSELLKKYVIVHQTGDSKFGDYERLRQKQDSGRAGMTDIHVGMTDRDSGQARMTNGVMTDNYYVTKWIGEEDMGRLFSTVDLAVSRCGANTLLELAYHQVPTLMIPLASVTKDEQTKNARFFASHGLGKVLVQKGMTGEKLVEVIANMLGDKNLKNEAKRAKEVVILDAEKKLAQEILLMEYRG